MGLQGCHASHSLPLYPLDFRTDPGAGANPRPAWLPGTERRCSAGGALWESEACEQGVGGTECVCLCCGGGGPFGIHDPEVPSNIAQFLPVVYFLFSVWLPACHIVSF